MALFVAATSGNYPDGSTWIGGIAPGDTDDSDVAGFNVTASNPTLTANSITDSVGTGSIIIPGNTTIAAPLNYLTVAVAGLSTLTVSGNVTGCTISGGISTMVNGSILAGAFPAKGNVLSGQTVGNQTGTLVLPAANKVQSGTVYGVNGNGSTGTLSATGGTAPIGTKGYA